MQEVCAVRLRQLHKLAKLTDVTMGMKDEVVPHINDRAMAELAAFRNLKGLDLQNCTHISDQGVLPYASHHACFAPGPCADATLRPQCPHARQG
jgi:hypothetical protein